MRRALLIGVVVVALDQLTKLAALRYLTQYEPIAVAPFFNLTLVYNRGAAFGFLSQAAGWQNAFFIAVALIASVVMVYLLRKTDPQDRVSATGLSLILGGAVGNLIDRIAHGHVVDFIDVYYGSWHWPAFNIADSAITIGAALLLLGSFTADRRRARAES